jgi:hypothetical protein
MDRLMLVMTGLSVALIVLVLFSVRRSHIRVEYSVSWLGAAVTLLAISRWRSVLDALSEFLGIASPPLAFLFTIGCVFVLVFFRFSVIISALKDANISLAQRVAILEFQLRSLDENQKTAHTR